MRNKKSLLKITYTGIFTAIILIATSVIKFSTGLGEGYIHLGDSFVYLSACILPFPFCLIAGGLGGALADILSGYAIWAIPTMLIKMLNAVPFAIICRKYKSNKTLSKGILKERCSAKVNSTTPKLLDKCPPCSLTVSNINFLISLANSSNSFVDIPGLMNGLRY